MTDNDKVMRYIADARAAKIECVFMIVLDKWHISFKSQRGGVKLEVSNSYEGFTTGIIDAWERFCSIARNGDARMIKHVITHDEPKKLASASIDDGMPF